MMRKAILVLNAGSSSIKFLLFAEQADELEPVIRGQIEGIYTAPHFIARNPLGGLVAEQAWGEGVKLGHDGAVAHLAAFLPQAGTQLDLGAVGHRVVHGGLGFARPVRLNHDVLAELEKLVPLAPLHQPHNLAPIRLLLERRPGLPQVACFDTAFHSTNPDLARRFAIPAELHDAGVRRYGFHGLSYEYVASVLPECDARAAAGRVVVCHLGNGSSMCAMQAGKSVASTMGFTAVEGLAMGTRCGTLDPGVLLYLMDERRMDARAIEKLLYNQSGLLGISGISSDMRKLLDSDDPRASLAVDLYVYRIRRELGSLAAALGGLDALVFTAGIGENSAAIRERVCRDAAWLGVELDAAANGKGGPRITAKNSRVSAWVIPTNEELMIARHTQRLIAGSPHVSAGQPTDRQYGNCN
jgi:acetate kinase